MITGTNTLTYSIKHALSIIYDTSGILDWYTNNQDNQNNVLWIDNGNQKSSFDPCPMGWKVPKNGTWNDYSTTSAPFYIQGSTTSSNSLTASNGRLYNLMTWYPSGGYRYSMSGLLRGVGSSGCYWSSTSDETNARYMDITKSYVNPNHTLYRVTGRFVRCVQK